MELYYQSYGDVEDKIDWDLKNYTISKDGDMFLKNGKRFSNPITAEDMTVESFKKMKKHWLLKQKEPKNWRHFIVYIFPRGIKVGMPKIKIYGGSHKFNKMELSDEYDAHLFDIKKRNFNIDSEFRRNVIGAIFKE